MKIRLYTSGSILVLAALGVMLFTHSTKAQDDGEFALQVTPSPLVATLKPGQSATLDLKIRNQGAHSENLKIQSRDFHFDSKTQKISIDDTRASSIEGWLSFSSPTFSIGAGQTITQRVTLSLPKEAGFNYSFALVISRVAQSNSNKSSHQLKGSLALFTLINIDRPGATRKLELGKINTSKQVYEYLPAEVDIELKNTGNSIFQPRGNVFIQRGEHDKEPINTLALNANNAYILPGTTRVIKVEWADGFQVEKTTTLDDGSTKKGIVWDWSNLSHLRIGHYTAKVVVLYNDGQRDIPLEGSVGFWIFPWKLLLGVLVIILFIAVGVWSTMSKFVRLTRKARAGTKKKLKKS